MTVITFDSIKGGVGKSSSLILLSNCLGAAGNRVLVIDTDWNDSTSFYYLNEETRERSVDKNIAEALFNGETCFLSDYIMLTDHRGVDIIPSSVKLIDLSSGLSDRRLSQLIKTVENDYDFIIIDTHPTHDQLNKNAIAAADFIITPINPSQFDFNTAVTLRKKLILDTDKVDNWYLFFNGYNHRFENAKSGDQKDYLSLFQENFNQFTPSESWLPWTNAVTKIIDRNLFLSGTKKDSGTICKPALYNAVCNLADCFVDGDFVRPEEF